MSVALIFQPHSEFSNHDQTEQTATNCGVAPKTPFMVRILIHPGFWVWYSRITDIEREAIFLLVDFWRNKDSPMVCCVAQLLSVLP